MASSRPGEHARCISAPCLRPPGGAESPHRQRRAARPAEYVYACMCVCVYVHVRARLKAQAQAAHWYLLFGILPFPRSPLLPPLSFFSFLFQAHFVEFLPLSASAPRHFAGSSPSWAGAGAGAALLSAGGRRRRCVKRRARSSEPRHRRSLRLPRRPLAVPPAGSGRPAPTNRSAASATCPRRPARFAASSAAAAGAGGAAVRPRGQGQVPRRRPRSPLSPRRPAPAPAAPRSPRGGQRRGAPVAAAAARPCEPRSRGARPRRGRLRTLRPCAPAAAVAAAGAGEGRRGSAGVSMVSWRRRPGPGLARLWGLCCLVLGCWPGALGCPASCECSSWRIWCTKSSWHFYV